MMYIHPTACVSVNARLGNDIEIGGISIIDDNVVIGDRVRIRSLNLRRF